MRSIAKHWGFALTLFITACGGGGGDQAGTGATSGAFEFNGVREISPNADGTWTVWWSPVFGTTDVKYDVFQRGQDGAFDFKTPIAPGLLENSYITSDLRQVDSQCFVVRFRQAGNDSDENSNELCTNHEAYKFEGVREIVSLRNGQYVLKWDEPPFEGALFEVFSRLPGSDEWKPLELTQDPFFKTEPISLDDVVCFRVRYRIEGFPEDTNAAELCTAEQDDLTLFEGVKSLSSPGKGQLKVTWDVAARDDVVGYKIYLGNDFSNPIKTIEGRDLSEFVIEDLLHAVVYRVGVRSVDVFGREDENKEVKSFELANHVTAIPAVRMVVVDTNEFGRPTKMRCEADYTDADDWQTLQPTFTIRNNKRDDLGLVERLIVEGANSQISAEYTLDDEDHRSDELICEVKIDDGFDVSPVAKSEPYTIPDTPVVATGMFSSALENTEIDLILARGPGIGYLDFDRDNAFAVEFQTTHGSIVSDPAFSCIDGTCSARFKPDKDFYTNSDSPTPEYATVRYKISAGDSISDWATVAINVRPVPRALSFDMIAQQDEDRNASVGRATEIQGDEVITFAAYTHVLNRDATMLYVRHPLSETEYKGKVRLPDGIDADPAAGVGCTTVSVTGWSSDGFECAIPCTDGKCPFTFLGDVGYYGPAAFDFAVVADGIQSNYATARVTILPNLRATGFFGLTVQGRAFEINMTEGQGYQGAQGGMQITSIAISTLTQNATMAEFSGSFVDPEADGIWSVTFTPANTATFQGYVKFKYIVHAINTDNNNEPVESNEGEATIYFYPKPVATGISIQAIENRDRPTSISRTPPPGGYTHPTNDAAHTLEFQAIDNVVNGYIGELGETESAGTLVCASGICNFTYVPRPNVFDAENEVSLKKFEYRVKSDISQAIIDTPGVVLDPFLVDPTNRTLVSEWADGDVAIRAVPKPIALDLPVAENVPGKPSSLSIVINLGDEFTHAYNFVADAVSIVATPSRGAISDFNCVADGTCTATYTPEVGQSGVLAPPLQYTVTVEDGVYQPEMGIQGLITSDPQVLSIDVRPMPKTTGLALVTRERTDFAANDETIEVELNQGYTHANSLPITDLTIVEDTSSQAAKGLLSAKSCATQACTVLYTPSLSIFPNAEVIGKAYLNYTVEVEDARLGPLISTPGVIELDIRPLPRANDFGASADLERVLENTARAFTVGEVTTATDPGYRHAYGTNVKDGTEGIVITDFSNTAGSVMPAATCVSGSCSVNYNPAVQHFTPDAGHDFVEYKVVVFDEELQEDVESNVAKIWIDVYPRPRATSKKQFVLQSRIGTLELELATGELLDESAQADLLLHKGYAHRRDHLVDDVTPTLLTRGTFDSGFSCDGAGVCTASYNAPAYEDGTVDSFEYQVAIGDVTSEVNGNFEIEVLPTATALDIAEVTTIEGEDVTIDFDLGTEYTHPITGTKATKIEVMSVENGSTTIVDLDAGSGNCSTFDGKCQVTFSPGNLYFTPEDDLQDAFFKYVVYTYSPELQMDVASNEATVYVVVRPKPRALGLTSEWAVQGNTHAVTFMPLTSYSYAWLGGFAKEITTASPDNGSLSGALFVCNNDLTTGNGACGPVTFTPGTMGDGDPYYGDQAKFTYVVKVEDAWGVIESDPAEVVIDYRPKPKATGRHFKAWQQSDLSVIFTPNAGYEHPYYGDDPNQYRAASVTVTSYPGNGDLVGNDGSEFVCDLASPHGCEAIFAPNDDYYYDSENGFLQLSYVVATSDPVAGTVTSDPGIATLEFQPIAFGSDKAVKGVQTVPKIVRLAPGDGFVYPGAIKPSITPSDYVRGLLTGNFACADGTNICTGEFSTTDSNVTGIASFKFKVNLVDTQVPTLDPFSTPKFDYEIDFYPIPRAQNFPDTPTTRFLALEGVDKEIVLFPASYPSAAACISGHNSLAPQPGYLHEYCDKAVEIIVTGVEDATFVDDPEFECDVDGKCTALMHPSDPGGDWPGYGSVTFTYKVRIDPEDLVDEPLTPAERAALTSAEAAATVNFYPRPYATGITMETESPGADYIYAIEGEDRPLIIERCPSPETQLADCHKGYMHGNNDNASGVDITDDGNVSIIGMGCNPADGRCQGTLRPTGGYFSAVGANAAFDYNVRAMAPNFGEISSNIETVKVIVYPKPKAQNRTAFGKEGEDLTLTIALGAGAGYTHDRSAQAKSIEIYQPPSVDVGWFVDPDSDTFLPETGDGLAQAFVCENGSCTATFRAKEPLPTDGAKTAFLFRVKIDGPADMPAELSALLVSTGKQYEVEFFPKPKVQNIEVVAIEGVAKATKLDIGTGYTYGKPPYKATSVMFLNAVESDSLAPSLFQIGVNETITNGRLSGVFNCASGTFCEIASSDGLFNPSYQSDAGTWIQTEDNCAEVGANCPTINFNVEVSLPAPINLDLVADVPATISWNVRPRPRAATANLSLMAPEGETASIEFTNGSGYSHPFYNAKAVSTGTLVHGTLQAAFDCTTTPTKCSATFVPDPAWIPADTDVTATVAYGVTVNDPTPRTAPETGLVGDLTSPDTGTVAIEYRPKPRATDYAAMVPEASDYRTITLRKGAALGYTHPHYDAVKLLVIADTQEHLEIENCSDVTGCEIACDLGNCSVRVRPLQPFFTDDVFATFDYKVVVEDPAFGETPVRELESINVGTVSIDVRPLPVAYDLAVMTKEDTNVGINLKNLVNMGYTHHHGYLATGVSPTNPSPSIVSAFVCEPNDTEALNYGQCDATFTPGPAGYFGDISFNYTVTVYDPLLGESLTSPAKEITVTVRPVPDATGLPKIYVKENLDYTITIAQGQANETTGYFYPDSYALWPDSVDVVTPPSVAFGAFGDDPKFSCNTSGSKQCTGLFSVVPDTYGDGISFTYRVKILDDVLEEMLLSDIETVDMEIRPIIRNENLSWVDLDMLKGIEGQNLAFTLENSTGFIYPGDVTDLADNNYSSVLDTITFVPGATSGGSVIANNCTSQTCDITFDPTGKGEATLAFRVQVEDALLSPSTIESETKTLTLDFYPLPVVNNPRFYTVEDTAIDVAIARGNTSGYTHDREDAPTDIAVEGSAGLSTPIVFDCVTSPGSCGATVTPTAFTSVNDDTANAARVEFKVTVDEENGPRSAQSAGTGNLFVTVYPRPELTLTQNVPIWAGEDYTVTLQKGADPGYTHPVGWGHLAKGVSGTASAAATLSAWSEVGADSGIWQATFKPPLGTYGAGAAYIDDLRVKNEYDQLTDPEVWSAASRLNFNVRPTPSIPDPAVVDSTYAEFEHIDAYAIQEGTHFTYEGDLNNVVNVKVRTQANSHMTCENSCTTAASCTNGVCTLGVNMIPEDDFHRQSTADAGTAFFEYQVIVEDDVSGLEKASPWARMEFKLLPLPDSPTAAPEFEQGIEGEEYTISMDRDVAYTHVEDENPVTITIRNPINLAITGWDGSGTHSASCATGNPEACPLAVNPIATGFLAVPGKAPEQDGTTRYGWAAFEYKMSVEIAGKTLQMRDWSTAYTHFYPKPVALDREVVVIEGEETPVRILADYGYEHPLDILATEINFIASGAAGVMNVSNSEGVRGQSDNVSCSGGVCTLLCSTGICTTNFTGVDNFYSQTTADCTTADAKCPEVTYNVSIMSPWSALITSDDPATLSINVRKKPTATDHPIAFMVPEGETAAIAMQKNVAGYSHPYYNASSVGIEGTPVNGIVSGGFDCSTAPTCDATFTPSEDWNLDSGRTATIDYKVTVTDPTPYTAPDSGTVGAIISDEVGQVVLTYRPKPKPTSVTDRVVEGTTGHSVYIALDHGYTHIDDKRPKQVIINGGSWAGVTITNPECTNSAVDCTLTCGTAPDQCVITYDADSGYHGENGGFTYKVVIHDDGFLPAPRDLTSATNGTAIIDVRPRPVAQELTFVVEQDTVYTIVLERGDDKGYNHAYDYEALDITVIDPPTADSTGDPVNKIPFVVDFTCPDLTDPDAGRCTAQFTPNVDFFGAASLSYKVTVSDPVLGQNIDSLPKELHFDVRPVAIATGWNSDWVTLQDESRDLSLLAGTLAEKAGYYYPSVGYDEHPAAINITALPAETIIDLPASFDWICTTGITEPRGCTASVAPVNGAFGQTSFSYTVSIDDDLFPDPLVSHDAATIDLDVRPNIFANDTAAATNATLYGIENTEIDFDIQNGVGMGYVYPTAALYSSVLNTLQYEVKLPANVGDQHGAFVAPTASCVGAYCACTDESDICSGKFQPETDHTGDAFINFRVKLNDAAFADPLERDLESEWKTLTMDFYPRPDGEVIRYYTVEGLGGTAEIKQNDGSARGYLHEYGHPLKSIEIKSYSSDSGLQVIPGTSITCEPPVCDVLFAPTANFSTDLDGSQNPVPSYFTFLPTVREPTAPNREPVALDEDAGKVEVVVYPMAVADATDAPALVVWEGATTTVAIPFNDTLDLETGYKHKWGHKAAAVVPSQNTESSLTGSFSCDTAGTGDCTHTDAKFNKRSTFDYSTVTANAYLDYKITTQYAPLADPTYGVSNANVTSTTEARINVFARAVPDVPESGRTELTFVEDTEEISATVLGLSITRNNGYTYADVAQDVDMIELQTTDSSIIRCADGTCNQTACTTGSCPIEELWIQQDYNRASAGSAIMNYRVRVTDSMLETKYTPDTTKYQRWTDWAPLEFELIPRPRGTVVERDKGIEGVEYAVTVTKNDGYTHVESGKVAAQIRIKSAPLNIASINGDTSPSGKVFNCNGAGECALTIAPITTAFADTSRGGDNNGTETYGWAEIEYEVKVSDYVDVWSTQGTMYVYFRPTPKAEIAEFLFDNGVEAENHTAVIRLKDGTACTSNCGFEHDLNWTAQEIRIDEIQNGTFIAGTAPQVIPCTAGVCLIETFRPDYGRDTEFKFWVRVNDADGDPVWQQEPGIVKVTFHPRHRMVDGEQEIVEGSEGVFEINNGDEYTLIPTWTDVAQEVIVKGLTDGSIQYTDDLDVKAACDPFNTDVICPCFNGSCTINFTHSVWPDDVNTRTEQFSFRTRSNTYHEFEYPEVNADDFLEGDMFKTFAITMQPRLVALTRTIPRDAIDQGLETSEWKTVTIREGVGGLDEGGYKHTCHTSNQPELCLPADADAASTITIPTMANIEINNCAGPGCVLACATGECAIEVKSLDGALFNPEATFTYAVSDGTYTSHKDGAAAVYFYPRPIPNTPPTVVIGQGDTGTITINRGPTLGYTHLENDPATGWSGSDIVAPPGSVIDSTWLSGWACTGTDGQCTVELDLSTVPTVKSTSAADVYQFGFDVETTGEGGIVASSAGRDPVVQGIVNVEIFPSPTSIQPSFNYYWVEDIGSRDNLEAQPPRSKWNVRIERDVHYEHLWDAQPKKILVTPASIQGGTLGSFLCTGNFCDADFEPNTTSADNTDFVASFEFRVVVADEDKYLAYPSDPMTYNIVVMPKVVPEPSEVTVELSQARGNVDQIIEMATTADLVGPPVKYRVFGTNASGSYTPFSTIWTGSYDAEISFTDVEIGNEVTGTLDADCTGGVCTVTYTSNSGKFSGLADFQYKVKVSDPSTNPNLQGLWSETGWIDAKIDLAPYYDLSPPCENYVTGATPDVCPLIQTEQVIDAVTGAVIPVTEVPITITEGNRNGYIQNFNGNKDMKSVKILGISPAIPGQTQWICGGAVSNNCLDFADEVTDNGVVVDLVNNSVTELKIGTFVANYVSTSYGYGDIIVSYQVCATDCDDVNDVRTVLAPADEEKIKINIDPKDIPPLACDKLDGDRGNVLPTDYASIIVFNAIPKVLDLGILSGETCGNGTWWTDVNPGDSLNKITFKDAVTQLGPSFASAIVGVNTTVCAESSEIAGDLECVCAIDECRVQVVPAHLNINSDFDLQYIVTTNSSFIPNKTSDSEPSELRIKTINPNDVKPVVTSKAIDFDEDVPTTVQIAPEDGYKSIADLVLDGESHLYPAPDGYAMLAEELKIDTFSSSLIEDVSVTGCEEGICSISITPTSDEHGSVTLGYQVKANGVWSATSGSLVITINPINDPPNTYANYRTHPDNGKNGVEASIHREFRFDDYGNDGVFVIGGVGQSHQLSFKPFSSGAVWSWGENPCDNCDIAIQYGYFDADGDEAERIEVHPDDWAIVGDYLNNAISREDAFPCTGTDNTAGISERVCTAMFEPTQELVDSAAVSALDWRPQSGVKVLTFRYRVHTQNDAEGQPTPSGPAVGSNPLWSEADVWIATGDQEPAIAKHLPIAAEENPDIEDPAYPAAYSVGRNSSMSIVLQYGPDGAYNKNQWFDNDRTEIAKIIEIANGKNGDPAAPVNGTIQNWTCDEDGENCTGGFTCNLQGNCAATFLQNNIITEFPAEASFWYRVVTSPTYTTADSRNLGANLLAKSEWKKVTMKILVIGGVGCTEKPELSYHRFLEAPIDGTDPVETLRALPQATPLAWNLGVEGGWGNFYNHTGTGGLKRPLENIEILQAVGGTVDPDSIDCTTTANVCTAVFTPTGTDTPDPSDDFVGHARIRLRAFDDWGCFDDEDWYVNVVPRVSTRNICKFDYTDDKFCIQSENDIHHVGPGGNIAIPFRKKPGIDHLTTPETDPNWMQFNSWEYMTWDGQNPSKIVISGFDADDYNLLKTTGGLTDAVTIADGVSCNLVPRGGDDPDDLVCEVSGSACNASGNCAVSLNAHNTGLQFGWVNFQYDVYQSIGGTEFLSRGIQARDPGYYWPQAYNLDDKLMWHHAVANQYSVYVKTKPVPNNPTFTIGVNTPTTIQLGRVDDGLQGYTYLDSANFAGKPITINAENVENGNLQSTSFDQNTKVLTVTFEPEFNFVSGAETAELTYNVSVWDVMGDPGTVTFIVKQYHDPDAITASTELNTTLERDIVLNTDFTKVGAHSYEPIAIEIKGADLETVDPTLGAVTSASCADGTCSFAFEPANLYVGTVPMKYRLQSGPAGEEFWTQWADLTVDVIDVPAAPVSQNLSFTSKDSEDKIVVINKGATAGYTDINNDSAIDLSWTNVATNFSITQGSPVPCTDGMCLINFSPGTLGHGVGTFDYQVRDNDGTSNTSVVSVDFVPQIIAKNFTVVGSKNNDKVVTFDHNAAYTYRPGALATDIYVTSVTGGIVTEGNATWHGCVAGSCSLTFRPTADSTDSGLITYKLRVSAGDGVWRESLAAVATVNISSINAAAIATDLTKSMADHTSLTISFALGSEYTDVESDKATKLFWDAPSLRGGALAAETACGEAACTVCDVGGQCELTFTPDAGFRGAAEFRYLVQQPDATEGTIDSNWATVSIDVPLDDQLTFALAWAAAPSLSATCELNVPGTFVDATCDGACDLTEASIDAAFASGGAVANSSGFTANIDGFTPGNFLSEWSVTDAGETATIARYLQLSAAAPTEIQTAINGMTPTTQAGMPGMQAPVAGCTGGTCNEDQKLASVAAGDGFSCGLSATNAEVRCWGSNTSGQLGRGSAKSGTTQSSTPTAILNPFIEDVVGPTGTGFDAVVAGRAHACALYYGFVACWGDNDYGQLGDNSTNDRHYPVFVRDATGAAGTKLANIVSLAAGSDHTCAVSSSSELYCWGRGDRGQLGRGDTNADNKLTGDDVTLNNPVPALAQKLLDSSDVDPLDDGDDTIEAQTNLDNIVAVTAGTMHTCAVRNEENAGEVSARHVVCFGANDKSQTGDNDFVTPDPAGSADTIASFGKAFTAVATAADRLLPTAVRASDDTALNDVAAISSGADHTCALKVDGTVFCWGDNANARAGQDPATAILNNPQQVFVDDQSTPLSQAVVVAAGTAHTCVVDTTQNVHCWGSFADGRLGDGVSTDDQIYPVAVTALSQGAVALATGNTHSCAVSASGAITCWGSNTTNERAGMSNAARRECGQVFSIVVP